MKYPPKMAEAAEGTGNEIYIKLVSQIAVAAERRRCKCNTVLLCQKFSSYYGHFVIRVYFKWCYNIPVQKEVQNLKNR